LLLALDENGVWEFCFCLWGVMDFAWFPIYAFFAFLFLWVIVTSFSLVLQIIVFCGGSA